MWKTSNIDIFLPCVTPFLKDYYHHLLCVYNSFECISQNMVLFLYTSSLM